MSDFEYDQKYRELVDLETAHPEYIDAHHLQHKRHWHEGGRSLKRSSIRPYVELI